MNPTIRNAAASDEAFLREMLYVALFVPPDRPPFAPDVVDQPELARYVDGFGTRGGDVGFIAELDGRPVGAAWVRQLTDADPGYGFVDAATPELSIAVSEEHRRRHVGTTLMEALLATVPRCSLSVDRRNPAARLYERLGFVIVTIDGDSQTMVRLGNQPTESALVVPVPAAELVVEPCRQLHDGAARLGVPAHVTVLYPFAPPASIDTQIVSNLRQLFSSVTAFAVEFHEIRWFGELTAWLAPEPANEFSRLTSMVAGRWPQYPPYRGEHENVVPHLTIGDGGPSPELTEAAAQLETALPIRDLATEVWLMAGSNEVASWKTVARFPLSTGQSL